MARWRSLAGLLAAASLVWAAALPCACPEMLATAAGRDHCGAPASTGPHWKAAESCACTCRNGGETARMPVQSGACVSVVKSMIAPAVPAFAPRGATVGFVAMPPPAVSPPVSPPLVLRV